MRWKVLMLASLASAIAGVGLALLITLVFYNSVSEMLGHGGAGELGVIIVLVLAVSFAGFFVYRHTARRRKLQTTLAVVFTLLFTVAAFALAALFTPKAQLWPAPAARGLK